MIHAKFTNETRHQAKQYKMATTSIFNFKSNKIQHDFNFNLTEELEDLLHLSEQRFVKRSCEATKNTIEKLNKKSNLVFFVDE